MPIRRSPFVLAFLLLLTPPADAASDAGLRARAGAWIATGIGFRTAGLPHDRILHELEAIADTLQAAGLDSLACTAMIQASFIAHRLGDGTRAAEDCRVAIAAGKRAGDTAEVIRAELLQAIQESDVHFDESLRTMKHAADYYASVDADSDRCDVLENIAVAYKSAGRYEDALHASVVLEEAAKGCGYTAQEAEALVLESICLALESRETEALEIADRALVLAPRSGRASESILARVQTARAVALRALGRGDEALAAVAEAVRITAKKHDLRHLRSLAYMKGLIDFDAGRYQEVVDGMQEPIAGATRDHDEWPELTYRIMEAGALVALGRYAPAESALAELTPRVEGFRQNQLDEETRSGFFSQLGELYAVRARLLVGLNRFAEAWASVERGRAQTLKARLGGDIATFSPGAVQAHLARDHAALIQMSEPLYNPVLAFVVTGNSVRVTSLGAPLRAQEAADAIALLASGAAEAECRDALVRLADRCLGAVPALLSGDVERLIIVPPTAMAGVPYEALPLPGPGGERLGDRRAVSYLPSAELLETLSNRSPAGSGMLVLADPALEGKGSTPSLPAVFAGLAGVPLPAARDEARAIAIPGARVFTGRAATRERLVAEEPSRFAVLHFATHAVQNTIDPDSSGLLLGGRDGLVDLDDVERLPLHADLVTLSGCRTAAGRMFRGEGVFGLSRSFLIAGSRSVVTSLWDVEDRAAARFMGGFYDGLKSGLPRDEALRRARIRMRESGSPPRDWAAFVLTGVGNEPVPSLVRPDRGSPLRKNSGR